MKLKSIEKAEKVVDIMLSRKQWTILFLILFTGIKRSNPHIGGFVF